MSARPTQPEEHLPELDLRLTQNNLEDVYENAPCGYCSCLPDGTLVKLNQTLLSWVGYQRQELVAYQCLQDLLTTGGRLHYELHCGPLLLLQGSVREMSYSLRHKNGSTLPVLLNADLVRDAAGQPLVVRVTLFNITERRRYERELMRAKREAEEQREQLARANEQLVLKNNQLTRINQDLDSFVYTASHDLKQPITNMAGLFAELKHTATFHDPEARLMMRLFDDSLRQILSTIEDLVQVVQLQRQLEQTPAETVAVQPVAEEIIRHLQPRAEQQQALFCLDVADVPALRLARPSLHSIFYNLLSNALKYAYPGRTPRILVRTELVEGVPVLSVQDNGRGLDLERHGRELFQLFRRFHPEVGGTGVGLYLVNRLITQAGGRLEVASTVSVGTTFRLFLPA